MDGDSISSPVTLDISRPDGGSMRRKSLAAAESVSGREKMIPHYLRASTGTCHDFCKYGKKHESKSFLNSRSHTPDFSESIKLQLSTHSPDGNNSTTHGVLSDLMPDSCRHTSDILKSQVSTNSSGCHTSRKHGVMSEVEKTSIAKLRSSSNLKSHLSDTPRVKQKGGSPSSKKVGASSKQVSLKAKEKSFSRSGNTSPKLKSHALKLPSVPSEGFVKRSNGISDVRFGKRTNTAKVTEKKALSLPSASLLMRASLARMNQSLKAVPPQKNQNKAEIEQPLEECDVRNNNALEEKTLYVIKMETENMLLESDKNENCAAEFSPPVASSPKSLTLPMSPPLSSHGSRNENESEYTEDDSNSEYYEDDETINADQVKILMGENGGRTRNCRTVISDEKNCQPVKLSFRRGKVVDIESENNGPRRLKFRRGKQLGVNQNVKGERRTFRTGELDGRLNDNQPGGEIVVLRHQDLQGNKDEKGLFNNVIEETASKLVETRKSKVKALVGAFETVISLQDAKPSANTVT
ncbi:hypothetical protein V6N13_089370 [Hibiscus sabdariffa]|uniref:Calmodulin-binding domain-containing protein n=1 Tax=Hibiscus sabdariffa TaxID=183260 RepID=A0ABR2NSK6_9ROSI